MRAENDIVTSRLPVAAYCSGSCKFYPGLPASNNEGIIVIKKTSSLA